MPSASNDELIVLAVYMPPQEPELGMARRSTSRNVFASMRPAVNSDVLADARIVRIGRSMAFGQVMLTGVVDPKPLAMVSSAYALM